MKGKNDTGKDMEELDSSIHTEAHEECEDATNRERFKVLPQLLAAFGLALITASSLATEIQTPVETIKVEFGPYSPPVQSAGRLANKSEQQLAFKVGGLIKHLFVEEGQTVKAGQVLAKLDQEEINAQVLKAQSVLDQAESKLKRLRSLEGQDFFSADGIQAAETALAVAQSDLRVAKFNQRYATIKAPADGVILKRLAELNEWVSSGQPLYVFANSKAGWVFRVGVSDRNRVRLNQGDPAWVSFDAYPNQSFEARVTEVATRADARSLTFEVEVSITETEALTQSPLYSGLIGNLTIEPNAKQQVALIPLTALVKADRKKASVFVLEENNQVSLREFNIEFLDRDMVAVSLRSAQGAQLQPGDQIVTHGAQYLTTGSVVVPNSVSADSQNKFRQDVPLLEEK